MNRASPGHVVGARELGGMNAASITKSGASCGGQTQRACRYKCRAESANREIGVPGKGGAGEARSSRRESGRGRRIDAWGDSFYIREVAVSKIQVGQVWKKDDSGENYLITKVYNEALATYALLRKAGAENERALKVKVDHHAKVVTLPGFSYTQQADDF